MSRQRGIFNLSGNYEPLIAAPLDARTVVDTKAELLLSTTWIKTGSVAYLFDGLLVAVTKDNTAANNGLYLLLNAVNYTSYDSWYKIADIRDINSLNDRIDQITGGGGGGAVQVEALANLPNVGSENTVYFVKNENATYRWDEAGLKYYCTGRDYQEIKVINGGNAEEFEEENI